MGLGCMHGYSSCSNDTVVAVQACSCCTRCAVAVLAVACMRAWLSGCFLRCNIAVLVLLFVYCAVIAGCCPAQSAAVWPPLPTCRQSASTSTRRRCLNGCDTQRRNWRRNRSARQRRGGRHVRKSTSKSAATAAPPPPPRTLAPLPAPHLAALPRAAVQVWLGGTPPLSIDQLHIAPRHSLVSCTLLQ